MVHKCSLSILLINCYILSTVNTSNNLMDLSLKMTSNYDAIVEMFQSRMSDYEDKLKKVTHADISSLSQDFINFKTFVWESLSLVKSQLELFSLGHERHEAHLRRHVLLIHGVLEEQNEDVLNTVTSIIVHKVGVNEFSNNNIEVCHRLGVTKGKTRPILIRFKDLECRHMVWDNKTSLKGSGYTISEFLTKARHKVFLEARKHFGVKNCWSSNGKIVILLPDKSRRKLELWSELQSLKLQFPVQEFSQDSQKLDSQNVLKSSQFKGKVMAKSPKRIRRKQ